MLHFFLQPGIMTITATITGTLSHKRVIRVDFDINGKVCRYPFENRPQDHASLGTLQQQADQNEADSKDQWTEWTVKPAVEGATIVSQTYRQTEAGYDWFDCIVQWPINGGSAFVEGIQVDVPADLSTEDEQGVIDAAAAQAVTVFYVGKNIFDA